MERIVWQPVGIHQPSYNFDVWLDRKFAMEMLDTKISPETQRRMNQLGVEIATRFGYNSPVPYNFEEDTALVGEFHLGSSGLWLAMDRFARESLEKKIHPEKTIIYSSHNVDCSEDEHVLLALFDQWVVYSDVLRKYPF